MVRSGELLRSMNRFLVPSALAAGLIVLLLLGSTKSSSADAVAGVPGPLKLTGAEPVSPAQMTRGARVYRSVCLACHLPDGRGFPGVCPPLAGADYMLADRERAIRVVLEGLKGPIVVNGEHYNGEMPPLAAGLTDQQVADVLTFAFNSWGNTASPVHFRDVAVVRARTR